MKTKSIATENSEMINKCKANLINILELMFVNSLDNKKENNRIFNLIEAEKGNVLL